MTRTETTTCAISGGGPAGIMLGLLLARAGVEVVVLEKHGDFLRDFRGDTVHPSTLQILDELGLIDELERIPHRNIDRLAIGAGEQAIVNADLAHLPGRYRHIAMIPQWDFLTLLTDHADHYPNFTLRMNAEALGPIEQDGAVRGIRYRDADGEHELRAVLTVAADGRHSTLREAAGMVPADLGAPMDALWLRVSRADEDPEGLNGRIGTGAMAAAIDRGSYWQIAYLIPKGGIDEVRAAGLERFRQNLRDVLPFLGERVSEVDDWEKVAFLKIGLNRLTSWHRPGLLAIGDAAHTMTPVGGVGINLAVQDAVATANLLADPLYRAQADPGRFTKTLNPRLPARVQRRRWIPTVGTQAVQRIVQKQVISRALGSDPSLPPLISMVAGTPAWSHVIARIMMHGILPEHVRTPERPARSAEPTAPVG
ncbi:2-polyprenyl-6-methoxyphenol hydroxylase-like FAD-dependent oxidoreductase [Spinactinospora alkalitolerans]|uniref:2-polyprenyl-6-methoxyphenol hydroxylase-like FAD-dependent oxidoreductase n=1 Tax=Spinactinospora alkalitolerans TaxID=687207 RepID=A0A852U0P5_9ACTN|nr:FAD-dependent oxidoreductase [Spinactinospora alkalitolerans]NYE49778.1 2-polyprenyl-6-methoxyphenol hydroxylase-like FAD-dependent oxidoreductase [Spinactinospora alkalitolerans]